MKIGFACGVFDLFHPGHVLMLEECKNNCDFLIIGLNKVESLGEGKNSPIFSFEERKLILESIKYIDKIIPYSSESELSYILKNEKIDIRFLGDDYKQKPITSPELTKEIYFCNRDHGYSTSNFRKIINENEKR